MEESTIDLDGKQASGYVVPMGPFNLVFLKTNEGMVGCGAFEVAALDRFEYPATRISGVTTIDDLLEGRIKEVNERTRRRAGYHRRNDGARGAGPALARIVYHGAPSVA